MPEPAPVTSALQGLGWSWQNRSRIQTQLKGVGPKFAEALHALGIYRFEQLARLTPVEIERLDTQLGPFRGRIQRDRLVEQADYLARGDRDGFEERFGKL